MTKGRRQEQIEDAFMACSTDEIHHVEYGDEIELDKVALATNKIYMLNDLRPSSPAEEIILDFPLETVGQPTWHRNVINGLYASYFQHCISHYVWSDCLRGLYVLKGMAETLDNVEEGDYLGQVDHALGRVLENLAYLDQMAGAWTPSEVKPYLGGYVREGPSDWSRTSIEDCKNRNLRRLWNHEIKPLLESPDGCMGCRSKFLVERIFPIMTELIRLDRHYRLAEFTYGILSIFTGLPPHQYFVYSLDKLDDKSIGFCPLRSCVERGYENPGYCGVRHSMEDLYQPELGIVKEPVFLYQHLAAEMPKGECQARTLYPNKLHLGIFLASTFIINYIKKNCRCDFIEQKLQECPMQNSAYKMIRRVFSNFNPDSWINHHQVDQNLGYLRYLRENSYEHGVLPDVRLTKTIVEHQVYLATSAQDLLRNGRE